MDEKRSVFRKKSIARISSPEQLNDYICVSSPSVWLILLSVAVLLAGVIIWGVFGTMNSYLDVCAVSENGVTTCYIKEDDAARVTADMPVSVEGESCALAALDGKVVKAETVLDEYDMHVGGIKSGEWVYPAHISVSLPDGTYTARILIESIRPMSFVFN